jgi:hypothetical protein
MKKALYINNREAIVVNLREKTVETGAEAQYFDPQYSVSCIKLKSGPILEIGDFPVSNEQFDKFLMEPKELDLHKARLTGDLVICTVIPKKNQKIKYFGKIMYCMGPNNNLLDIPKSEIKKYITPL